MEHSRPLASSCLTTKTLSLSSLERERRDSLANMSLFSPPQSPSLPVKKAKPPSHDFENFRKSHEFRCLERAVLLSSKLVVRDDDKFDLDSADGQKACKSFLQSIEKLCETFKPVCASREYRREFSKAYRILYREGALCYLPEILDSAQEGFPYLWVNGEKYIFSQDVLSSGVALYHGFKRFRDTLETLYAETCSERHSNLPQLKDDLCVCLEDFDFTWAMFEQLYVFELMLIEADARRYITEAIEMERDLLLLEVRERAKGKTVLENEEYHNCRKRLVQHIGRINAVANQEGKGRDDLAADIMSAAEAILRRSAPAKAVRVLATKIRQAFQNLRHLLRRYEQNIEMVDPQLKNNPDLVQALVAFESSWEKGKEFFGNNKKCTQLSQLSVILEAVPYASFQEQLETRDADIFMTIPCLVILKALDEEDRGICKSYLPDMYNPESSFGNTYKQLRKLYQNGKTGASEDYGIVIRDRLLDVNYHADKDRQAETTEAIHNKIQQLAMQLQRRDPQEWNRFMDAALSSY
eukprot:GILJ01001844.1.p1 GENE.GILJ01001844.1~~GILJ01001844.1.p1  ORF type:complete len:525 (-),score=85.05 GILJ01001844.1:95-1669(-)